jgi:polysaccharide export outer membrane protein
MSGNARDPRKLVLACAVWLCAVCAGCQSTPRPIQPCAEDLPHEKKMVNLPEYTIEPPDVLNIDALRLIPKPGHKLEPLDSIIVTFPSDPGALDETTLAALELVGRVLRNLSFRVDLSGNVKLAGYGTVNVAGLTIEKAEELIRERVLSRVDEKIVKKGKLTVELDETRGLQQVRGEHLVRPDGTINLGIYGVVYVCGLTEKQAKAKVEEQLSELLFKPEVLLEVVGFNSRIFYIITDVPGSGESIARLPVTGNDTVLTAMAQTGAFPAVSSRLRVWISRPAPGGKDQILPVYWRDITRRGRTETNYQLLPGDRLFLAATPLGLFSHYLNTVAAPIERVFSTILFGQSTIQSIRFGTGFFGGGFGSPFGFPLVPTPVQ